MARRGRKRKLCNRVNGRPVQLSEAQRERDVKKTVLDQPHRLGNEDQMRECAVGRMIMDCWWSDWWPDKNDQPGWSMRDLYTAAQGFEAAWADVQKVMASRRPLANETRRGAGPERTDEETVEWRDRVIRRWTEVSNAIGSSESLYRKAAVFVIIDNPGPDWVAPFWMKHALKMALVNLAEHSLGGKRRAA